MKNIYVITYVAYGTRILCHYCKALKLKKEAVVEARRLRACGHTHVKITCLKMDK